MVGWLAAELEELPVAVAVTEAALGPDLPGLPQHAQWSDAPALLLTRRAAGRAEPLVECGPLVLNPATHAVRWRGTPVEVSGREFALLAALAERPGAVVSRAQLEEKLYGWNESIGSNAVEVHIHHLRRKLGNERIVTMRGVGYFIPAE